MALQGLWAASWMKDGAGRPRSEIAYQPAACHSWDGGGLTDHEEISFGSDWGVPASSRAAYEGIEVSTAVLVHASLVVGLRGDAAAHKASVSRFSGVPPKVMKVPILFPGLSGVNGGPGQYGDEPA